MEYCPRCMRPVTAQFCTHCGCNAHEQNGEGMLPVGTRLTGSSGTRTYQLGKSLGMGGFGITYIALELETGNRVAVKEFFPSQCGWARRGADGVTVEPLPGKDSEYNRGRISFLKEARVLASMKSSHPAVMKGMDYVETHNTAYLVMEYLEGTPLYKVVRQRGGLSPEELLPKIDRLMDGVIWLHEKGIIHRDICPDNIMWMDDGTLKLMDFGSARKAEGNSEFTVQFKPGYAPVEQYTSGGQGPWTDVYTLAATICYCLTGQNPTVSGERILRQKESGVDPLQLPHNLDPRQHSVMAHALSIYPEERTQTMAQFRQELFPPASPPSPPPSPLPPSPPPPSPLPPPQPDWRRGQQSDWLQKNLIAVVSAVIILIVVFLAVILLMAGGRAMEAPPDGRVYVSAESAGPQNSSESLGDIEKTPDPAL